MDFTFSEQRLKADHDKLKRNIRNRTNSRKLASSATSEKARKTDEYRKKQLRKKKEKEQIERNSLSHVTHVFKSMERELGIVRNLSSSSTENGDGGVLKLNATSVYGLGDKITLPPSVLETLAGRDLLTLNQNKGQPLFFRLGIKNEKYRFPQSTSMKALMTEYQAKITHMYQSKTTYDETYDEGIEILSDDDDDDDGDDDESRNKVMEAYLDELACEYVSYTYATVVEFSQDEEFIGLPVSVATALLGESEMKNHVAIRSHLTIDPAHSSKGNDAMNHQTEVDEISDESKTPGHQAYGLFPVPTPPIVVTLLTNLPLGTKCTLQPTPTAVERGFYDLKDVKVALEQSLIRTRGCLNVGDLMHCWFRGKKFDLKVQDVNPDFVRSISCVNCDIEVDISSPDLPDNNNKMGEGNDSTPDSKNQEVSQKNPTGGYTLSSPRKESVDQINSVPIKKYEKMIVDLPAEPPIDQVENVVDVQIRGSRSVIRRRFDSTNSVKVLFDFVTNEELNDGVNSFNLVTRFPRRVLNEVNCEGKILTDLNLGKQEMFIVEK